MENQHHFGWVGECLGFDRALELSPGLDFFIVQSTSRLVLLAGGVGLTILQRKCLEQTHSGQRSCVYFSTGFDIFEFLVMAGSHPSRHRRLVDLLILPF